ncbi:HNH endonuclease [Devosia sp. MC1541]|uniref:HNH endonuclease n=1 Tax=Devosia sp. MC1541 TaxID=2725264 RepID=UPI00145D3216|nr:HNH endonuclease [Devosia sp. MC1541]
MGEVHAMQWRSCPRFPNFEVSEWGDVRRAVDVHGGSAGERLKGFVDADGYRRYVLTNTEGQKHHVTDYRLVAEAFIGPAPSERHEVAHNNGSRVCAHYSELRWATRKENHGDMKVHGTAPGVGQDNPRAKLTDADVIALRREYRAIKNRLVAKKISDLAKEYGLHHATVCSIVSGKSWSHIPLEAA